MQTQSFELLQDFSDNFLHIMCEGPMIKYIHLVNSK